MTSALKNSSAWQCSDRKSVTRKMMQKRQNQEKLLRVPCPLGPAREREGSAWRGLWQGWPAACCLPACVSLPAPTGREGGKAHLCVSKQRKGLVAFTQMSCSETAVGGYNCA